MRRCTKLYRMLLVMLAWFTAQPSFAGPDYWQMNMHRGVTPMSHDMFDLHMVAIAVCAIIGIVVFGVMIYSIIHHRKSKGHEPANFHENTRLEIVWTIIPFLILVALAIPATKVLIRMDDNEKSDVTIKIVGYQWKWEYQYLDEGIKFFSNLSTPFDQRENRAKKGEWYLLEVDKPLVLPIHRKVRVLVTSNDVIHSWWVPDLGIKRDAIPGFMHESWARIEKPGIYRGQCAELCGVYHGFMPIVVKAVTEEEYDKWVKEQPKVVDQYDESQKPKEPPKDMTFDELMALGKQKYDQICTACHKPDGTGIPPMFPALKGSSVAVGKPISRHIELILNGVPGSAMQAYKEQMSDTDIAAVVTYERNAFDNNTGDAVQPAEVMKVRNGDTQKPKMVKKAKAGGLR